MCMCVYTAAAILCVMCTHIHVRFYISVYVYVLVKNQQLSSFSNVTGPPD